MRRAVAKIAEKNAGVLNTTPTREQDGAGKHAGGVSQAAVTTRPAAITASAGRTQGEEGKRSMTSANASRPTRRRRRREQRDAGLLVRSHRGRL